jgi:signal peptidase I
MSTTALDLGLRRPAPALWLVPAAARLVGKALVATVVLGLLTLVVGPRLYPFESFYVRSGSMAPGIPVGALVVATRASADQLGVGDVIVFERPDQPGTMVTHRIVAVEETQAGRDFVTKGDANADPDPWRVPARGTGWQARYSFARAGFMVGWVHTAVSRRGWLGGVAIAAAVYALVCIWRDPDPE